MKNRTKQVDNEVQENKTDDWTQRALEAARQTQLPDANFGEAISTQEIERRLRDAEQEGGE